MNLEKKLKQETKLWLKKIKEKVKDLRPGDEQTRHFYRNVNAYINDSHYFLKEGKLVEAFEAVIWAWAWYEIGRELEIF